MPSVALDLRSTTKASVADDPTPGMGLFIDAGRLWAGPWQWHVEPDGFEFWGAPSVIDSPDYVDLGDDPLARMRQATRDALADMLGIDRSLLPDTDLVDLLAHYILGTLADSTGVDRVKPLRMGRRGLRLRLGSFGLVLAEPFSRNHPNFDATLAVRHADYRRNAAVGIAQEVLERWTGYDMLAFWGRRDDDLLSLTVPQKYIDEGHRHRAPATTIGDTFVEASDTNIDAHTATGPNGGHGYTVVRGTASLYQVESTDDRLHLRGGTSTTEMNVRAETDLSSDDHYSQLDYLVIGGGSARHSCLVRFNPNAEDLYELLQLEGSATPLRIFRFDAGARTELASIATDPGTGTYKLKVNGSDLEGFVDGVSKITATDTTHTGFLRVGFGGRTDDNESDTEQDNFEAADLAVGFAHSKGIVIA